MILLNVLKVSFNLNIVLMLLVQVNCFDSIRWKRQSRHRNLLNATSVILETQDRIINRTSISSSALTRNNFNRDEKQLTTCGGIYTQPQFIIDSPNYPSNYASDLNCLYIFKGPFCNTIYTLQFLDFSVEDSLGCTNDRLEVKYRDALCGSRDGFKTYSTPTGILELNFVSNSDTNSRGFRILVSRSLCSDLPSSSSGHSSSIPEGTTTDRPNIFPSAGESGFSGTTPAMQIPNGVFPIFPTNLEPTPYLPPRRKVPPSILFPNSKEPACCATTYSDKRFFISSPGFPHSMSTTSQCSFTIYRANIKVCRLRIHFHYFWVGEQSPTCSKGYLQIDGKLICGCHTGLKLVSPFDGHHGNTKVFRYLNLGNTFGGQLFSGFAVEVIQDECPKRYSPDSIEDSQDSSVILPRFNFYHDQMNRVGFPNLTHKQAISENTEIFEPSDLGFRPSVVKHVYFFESPDFTYDFENSYNKPRDIEETNYLETIDLNSLYPVGNDLNKCTSWRNSEWNMLKKDISWQRMSKCNDISRNYYPHNEENECQDYSFLKGYFQSPGYPYYYPKNLDICYRFYKQKGYCKIRLIMLDFQIEDSFDCRRDYLLLNNNFRYCGQTLANTFSLFDMSGKSYEQLKFITNHATDGRGFRGIYEQIPCLSSDIPLQTSTSPSFPFPTTTTHEPTAPCMRNIKDNYFTIDIYDYGRDTCNFNVYKTNTDVCKLEITFITFDFPCDLEYLEIKGRRYCGNLSGQMVYLTYEDKQCIPISYKRVSFKPGVGPGLKLHLVGRQTRDNCVELPPAQRILQKHIQIINNDDSFDRLCNDSDKKNNFNRNMSMEILKNLDDITVILRKKYPEVCGVVMSVKERKNDSICNIILNNKMNINCNPITDNKIYVPYKNATDKLELKFKDVETVQEMEFKEITCDNKFIL